MKIVVSGISSKLGLGLLKVLVSDPSIQHLYLLSRRPKELELQLQTQLQNGFSHNTEIGKKWSVIPEICNLPRELPTLSTVQKPDLLLHLAALTHSSSPQAYREVNFEGTRNLCELLIQKGCSRMVFMSSQAASPEAGDYGHSKFLAEEYLLKSSLQQVTCIRCSEVTNLASKEGLDRLESLRKNLHLYPVLFRLTSPRGWIKFHPITSERVFACIRSAVLDARPRKEVLELRGPELKSWSIYSQGSPFSLPCPLPVEVLAVLLSWLEFMGKPWGWAPGHRDQIPRLLASREHPHSSVEYDHRLVRNS